MSGKIYGLKLSKVNGLWLNGKPFFEGTVGEVVAKLQRIEQPIISVEWHVVENAPVSIEKQNATFARRCAKIADAIGKKCTEVDQIGGCIHGLVMFE